MITDGAGVEWLPHVLQHAIYNKIEDDEIIKSLKIEGIK